MAESEIRTLFVNAPGVTIKNLTIQNAHYNGDGAAVRFTNPGTVINCTFNNNGADYNSGAIHFDQSGTVTGCTFTSNVAYYRYGGAISMVSGTVTDCTLSSNRANCCDGGAIFFKEYGEVTNCNFTDNQVSAGSGGAIWFNGTGNVANCNFTSNHADSGHGGAIWFNGKGNVTNCNFTSNNVQINGGALYFNDNCNVTKCSFNHNAGYGSTSYGGAIYLSTGTVINCNFTGNHAYIGGAINFLGTGNVTNSNFDNNEAMYYAGAIWFDGTANLTNCSFTSNRAKNVMGGAIYINNFGTLTNCNFTHNQGGYAGAICLSTGTVINCNFIDNRGRDGGAIWVSGKVNVTNCNFSYNTANQNGGAIFSRNDANINNCIFIINTANVKSGGAIYIEGSVNVTNCNFTGNYAPSASAIYFQSYSSTKTVSNSTFLNNKANADGFQIELIDNKIEIVFKGHDNLINAIYSNTDVNLINVTYWGANGITNTDDYCPSRSSGEAGQNISVRCFINGNIFNTTKTTDADGKIVLEDVAGGYFIIVRHDENSYYTGFETINTNMEIYANVTETITTNKTVNITAKSNIEPEIMPGQLRFVLPHGGEIDAAYATEGVWWAIYTFDDYNDYEISGRYVGLDNVVINNALISVIKANSTVNVSDAVLNYGESINVTVTTEGATGFTAKINDNNVTVVDNYTIPIFGLDVGTYTLTVTTIPDENHSPVTKTATITVNKLKTQLTANAITTTYNINKDLVITLKDANGNVLSGVSVTVDLNGAKTYTTDSNGQVKVSTKGLAPKAYTAKITFNGNTSYEQSTKDVKVTVNKATPKLTAKAKTFKSSVKTKKYTITLKDNTGKAIKKAKVTLKVKGKTYKATTNSKGKATFKITKLTKKGTYKATITFKGDKFYKKVSKKTKIKVIVTFKTVSKGSKDKATVKEIQQALKDKGYYLTYQGHYLKVDGKFSSCTFRSVKEFQHDNGLKVTGKVDEKTAQKLKII